MNERQEAVELLAKNIGSLPHPEYGVINLMPFSVDSDQTNELRQQVCQAIVDLFADAGMLHNRWQPTSAPPAPEVSVNCRMCSQSLFSIAVDGSIANVPAAAVISAVAQLDPECPHKPLTPDDHRRKIEEAVKAAQGEQ